MIYTLMPHPDSPLLATALQVQVERIGSRLALTYRLQEAVNLAVPVPAAPIATDGLWKETCFEFFVKGPGASYYEFNLSPSTAWAAYGFAGYREGMAPLVITAPQILFNKEKDKARLEAVIDLAKVAGLQANETWSLGLTAVIRNADGRVAYWALSHSPGQADFHKAENFTALIPSET